MVICDCPETDKCRACGCCQHTPQNAWCATNNAPRRTPCLEPGCGCEGRS